MDTNPNSADQAEKAGSDGRIRKGIQVTLLDGNRERSVHVYLEQLGRDQDSWELILSQEQSQFSMLFLTAAGVKTLADFFGECARAAAKFQPEAA